MPKSFLDDMPKLHIPDSADATKNFKAIFDNQVMLFSHLMEISREIHQIKKEVKDGIEAEVLKNLGEKIHMIDSTLTETILQKEILIEKGYMTREEINQKYEELRKKKNG